MSGNTLNDAAPAGLADVLLDVFTDTPFQGNPLAAFPEAGTLEYTLMQGLEMGRPSRIGMLVNKTGQNVTAIHVD